MITLTQTTKANLAAIGIVGVTVLGIAGTTYLSYKAGQLIGKVAEKPIIWSINKLATYL